MIDVKEVRIGNIIHCLHEESVSEHTVTLNTINLLYRYGIAPDTDEFSRGLWYAPAPLTEDWVRRGGFKDGGQSSKIYRIFKISKSAHEGYDLHVGTAFNTITKEETGVNLKYVHQLQNLYFALTNNELTFSEKL